MDRNYIERLIPHLDVVVWEFDWDRAVFTHVSDEAVGLLGYPIEHWYEPRFWIEHLHPQDAEWVPQYCAQATGQRRDHVFEYRMVHADGSVVWIHDLTSVNSREGDPSRIQGLIMDAVAFRGTRLGDSVPGQTDDGVDDYELQVYEIDLGGSIIWANRSAEEFFRKDAGGLVGHKVSTLFPGDQNTSLNFTVPQSSSDNHRFSPIFTEAQDQDGNARMLEMWRSDTLDITGERASTFIIARELSLKDTLTATRARFDELQAITDLSGDVFLRLDQDGVCVDARVPTSSPLPMPTEGLIGHSICDVHAEPLRSLVRESLQQARDTRDVVTFDIETLRGDRPVGLEARILPLHGGDTAVMVRDVSARAERERRIAHSEMRQRNIVNGIPLGLHLLRVDEDDVVRLVSANPAADDILGIAHEQLWGMDLATAFPGVAELGLDIIYRRVALEGDIYENNHIKYSAGGTNWVFEIHAFQSSLREVTVLFSDVTERESAREREDVYRERLRALAAELTTVEDRARRRLAEDLHDRVSQSLAVAQMHLRQVQEGASCRSANLNLEPALHLISDAIQEARSLTSELSPPVLHELGLAAAIKWLCDESDRLYGLRCVSDVRLDPEVEVGEESELIIFRAAREFLVNVKKHAGVAHAAITLEDHEGQIVLTVRDDGCGFDDDGNDSGKFGFGLFSLRERLEYLGGSLEARVSESGGACAIARAPMATRLT